MTINTGRSIPDRERIATDLFDAWEALAELIEPLNTDEWNRGTRCGGWPVRDVAGHVAGMATDAANGRPTASADEQAAAHRDLSPGSMATTIRTAAGEFATTLATVTEEQWVSPFGPRFDSVGEAIQTLLHDTFVHSDDIASALMKAPWTGPGLLASVNTVVTRLERGGWSGPTIVIDDEPVLAGEPDTTRAVYTTARDFVLVATGRLAASTMRLPDRVNIYADRGR